jgi:hypothetical protein
MSEDFVSYRVVLACGPLSPAEDINTAIVAARQSQALGQYVERIEQGNEIVLEGDELNEALANLRRVSPTVPPVTLGCSSAGDDAPALA